MSLGWAQVFRKAVYALVPVVLLVASAELAARWLWDPTIDDIGGYLLPAHPTRIWSLPPQTQFNTSGGRIGIDELGLRSVPMTGAALRILTLGDSNVYGHDLKDEDTMHVQLQAVLADRGISTDVLCGGVPGYSTSQSLRLLDEVGWAQNPDLLVVANSLSDAAVENFTDKEWLHVLDQKSANLEPAMLIRSQAWKWLRSQFREPHRLDRRIRWVQEPNVSGSVRVPVSEYMKNLDKMLGEARKRGVGVVILSLAVRPQLTRPGSWSNYRLAQRQVGQFWQVPVVDGLRKIKTSGLTEDEAFMDTVHARGPAQQLYATAIADVLTDSNWPTNRLIPQPKTAGTPEPAPAQ